MFDPASPRRPAPARAPARTVPLAPIVVAGVFIVVGAVALRRTLRAPAVSTPATRLMERAAADDPAPAAAEATPPAATTSYTVAPGDTLSVIAARFGTSVEAIMALNRMTNPDALAAGQTLTLQAPVQGDGPAIAALPDGELVYGPAYRGFDVAAFVAGRGGALAAWSEDVNGETLTGPAIVARVVDEFSVGPRALLAVLEAKSGIVAGQARTAELADYPAGMIDPARRGLWLQLNWLADRLNGGYYDAKTRGSRVLTFTDGVRLNAHPSLNAGSVAVQRILGLTTTPDGLPADIAAVLAAYEALFGPAPAAEASAGAASATGSSTSNAAPDSASKAGAARGGAANGAAGRGDRTTWPAFPKLTLPFARGETWWLTGGPHGGWGGGSAWAAIDFVSDEAPTGCAPSAAWVTAAAAGLVLPAGTGQVILDLDGDGDRRTGPLLFHLHLAADGRVAPGATVRAGDPLGHPSCEGGVSNATHVHIARLYDGEWLAAGGDVPFELGGWTAYGSPTVYDGGLRRADGTERAACECRTVGGNDVGW